MANKDSFQHIKPTREQLCKKPHHKRFQSQSVSFRGFCSDLNNEERGILERSSLLFDLMFSEFAHQGRGEEFDSLYDADLWEDWLDYQWIPKIEKLESTESKHQCVHNLLTAIGSEVSGDVHKHWQWPGGGKLHDYVSRNTAIEDIIGFHAWQDCRKPSVRCNFDLDTIARYGVDSTEASENFVGSGEGGGQPQLKAYVSGEFKDRVDGPLPSNAARISPMEWVYSELVPEYFDYKIATSAINQRIYETEMPSTKISKVLVVLGFNDQEQMHEWIDGRPSYGRYLDLLYNLVDVLLDSNEHSTNIRLQLQIHYSSCIFEAGDWVRAITADQIEDLRAASPGSSQRRSLLHDLIPEISSEWPEEELLAKISSMPEPYDSCIEIWFPAEEAVIEERHKKQNLKSVFLFREQSTNIWELSDARSSRQFLLGSWEDIKDKVCGCIFGIADETESIG